MSSIACKKGCCTLKILYKEKNKKVGGGHPFEKRKAGVFVCSKNKVLLTQSYNNCWGIPKGQLESFDKNTKACAIRELEEETGLKVLLKDDDLYKIICNNYIYRIYVEDTETVNVEKVEEFDSTGIGWVDLECAFDLNINFLTKKILGFCKRENK